jgi:catechol 2,3-dioxygenase-like lactoylglutathione lyase family enzyme
MAVPSPLITTSRNPARSAGHRPGHIPTAHNVDHYAFTVPQLDRAIEFFVEVLGAEVAYRLGPIAAPETDPSWMSRQLDVHPDARTTIAMLRVGPVSNVELFEYDTPSQRRGAPRNCDPGGHHLGFAVTDLDAAVRYLRTRPGVCVLSTPRTAAADEPSAGERSVYFRSPWGMYFSLHQVPHRMPHEQYTPVRRFDPLIAWSNAVQPCEDPVTDLNAGKTGIPTATNVDHAAYTVSDLDHATEFLVTVLGAQLLYRNNWTQQPAELMAERFDVPMAGAVRRAMFRLGPTANVELSQYDVSGAATEWPRNSDIGGHHIAFWVSDLDAAVEYLAGQDGVTVLGSPITVARGPLGGGRWIYFSTPFGMTMEAVTFPDGQLPYEKETTVRRRAHEPAPWPG